jgi:hypothetical protein
MGVVVCMRGYACKIMCLHTSSSARASSAVRTHTTPQKPRECSVMARSLPRTPGAIRSLSTTTSACRATPPTLPGPLPVQPRHRSTTPSADASTCACRAPRHCSKTSDSVTRQHQSASTPTHVSGRRFPPVGARSQPAQSWFVLARGDGGGRDDGPAAPSGGEEGRSPFPWRQPRVASSVSVSV